MTILHMAEKTSTTKNQFNPCHVKINMILMRKKNELVDQLGDWCHTDIHLKPFPPNLSL